MNIIIPNTSRIVKNTPENFLNTGNQKALNNYSIAGLSFKNNRSAYEDATLGTNAKNVATDIIGVFPFLSGYKPVRHVRHAVKKEISRNKLAPERICDCGQKTVGKNAEFVRKTDNSITVTQLETCGSPRCPICGPKIYSRKAEELEIVEKGHRKDGGTAYLMTLTSAHTLKDSLAKTRKLVALAIRKFRAHDTWKRRIKKLLDYKGDCRGVEVTWGKINGFHLHNHFSIYSNNSLSGDELDEIFEMIIGLWQWACSEVNLKASRAHGVDIFEARKGGVADYITKSGSWGVTGELTSSHAKKAKNGNFTMHELMQMLIDKDLLKSSGLSLERVKAIVYEYMFAMAGAHSMDWAGSRKWRDQYLTDEDIKTDEEASKLDDDGAELIAFCNSKLWYRIYWAGLSGVVRSVYEVGGFKSLVILLDKFGLDTSLIREVSKEESDNFRAERIQIRKDVEITKQSINDIKLKKLKDIKEWLYKTDL
ncbi:MAG: hypothetical protein H8E98_05400 [Bacteroidetes bacterium]|nr:hypothetical protein [Bacteroidota bacterium]